MRRDDLFDALGDIDDKYIKDAKKTLKPRNIIIRSRRMKWIIPTVAAMLAIVLSVGLILGQNIPTGIIPSGDMPGVPSAITPGSIVERKYLPRPLKTGDNALSGEAFEKALAEWESEYYASRLDYKNLSANLDGFFGNSICEFLSGAEGENVVYSPLNVYMALAMLAELTDGNSRQQILDLLCVSDIETLRTQTSVIWRTSYCNTPTGLSILANSMWLNDEVSYNKETLETLAEAYYASSYQGTMGSDEYNQLFREWLNGQTGGLLEDQIDDLELNPNNVMALATTVFFRAKWYDEFDKHSNTTDTFYATDKEVVCEYMNNYYEGAECYWGDKFTSVSSDFVGTGGSMLFILPDEGGSVDELLSDKQTMEFIMNVSKWKNHRTYDITFSVPKFDTTTQLDLIPGLKELGVTDVFDSGKSDFSPMTNNADDIFVSEIQHGTRVVIDEEGCTAAAFTVEQFPTAGIPSDNQDLYFVLNRPFIFVITSDVGLPIFVGVINNPTK